MLHVPAALPAACAKPIFKQKDKLITTCERSSSVEADGVGGVPGPASPRTRSPTASEGAVWPEAGRGCPCRRTDGRRRPQGERKPSEQALLALTEGAGLRGLGRGGTCGGRAGGGTAPGRRPCGDPGARPSQRTAIGGGGPRALLRGTRLQKASRCGEPK